MSNIKDFIKNIATLDDSFNDSIKSDLKSIVFHYNNDPELMNYIFTTLFKPNYNRIKLLNDIGFKVDDLLIKYFPKYNLKSLHSVSLKMGHFRKTNLKKNIFF